MKKPKPKPALPASHVPDRMSKPYDPYRSHSPQTPLADVPPSTAIVDDRKPYHLKPSSPYVPKPAIPAFNHQAEADEPLPLGRDGKLFPKEWAYNPDPYWPVPVDPKPMAGPSSVKDAPPWEDPAQIAGVASGVDALKAMGLVRNADPIPPVKLEQGYAESFPKLIAISQSQFLPAKDVADALRRWAEGDRHDSQIKDWALYIAHLIHPL